MNRDRSVQQVRWFGIALASAMTRSVVHFYPSTSGVSAPYNVACRVSLFGNTVEKRSVALEGARLSQPDGVRLEEIFPGLGESSSGIFGVEFEVSSNQPRIDLSCSCCMIECGHGAHALRYVLQQEPVARTGEGALSGHSVLGALAVKDALNVTSLVALNIGIQSAQPQVFFRRAMSEGPAEEIAVKAEAVKPQHCAEISFPEELMNAVQPQEWPFGLVRARSVYVRRTPGEALKYFLVAREALTKRPVSVVPLGEGV